jgi:ATP-dependent exoDNAse (exonuclease V) beta subunit
MILKGQDIDIKSLPNEVKAAKIFWDDLKRKYNATTLKTEWVVGDTEFKVAGRIDALIQLEYDGRLITSLLDWKTGTIKLDNKYEKMKSPFNGLEDCSLNHYSIQLSLYRLIIERNLNIKLSHSILINLPESGPAKIIQSRDFRPTLEKLLLT